jgi:hypothetical protein
VGLGRSLGLGGSAKNAEEEAARLQAELEEERRAEEEARRELDKLMGEIQDEEATKHEDAEQQTDVVQTDKREEVEAEEDDVEADALDVELETKMADEEEPKPVAPVAPVEPPTAKSPTRQTGPVTRLRSPPPPPAQSISQVSLPPVHVASHTPVKTLRDVFESTTPAMSPPRRVFNVPQAKITSPRPESKSIAPSQPGRAKSPLAEPVPQAVLVSKASSRPIAESDDQDVDEQEEDVDLPELPEPVEADDERTDSEREDDGDDEEDVKEMPAKKMFKPSVGAMVGVSPALCDDFINTRNQRPRPHHPPWLASRHSPSRHPRLLGCSDKHPSWAVRRWASSPSLGRSSHSRWPLRPRRR